MTGWIDGCICGCSAQIIKVYRCLDDAKNSLLYCRTDTDRQERFAEIANLSKIAQQANASAHSTECAEAFEAWTTLEAAR